MKFGTVVNVCTKFLNHLHLISLKNIANINGKIDVANVKPLIAKVLIITFINCSTCVWFANNMVNHLKPTKSHCDNFRGGL
jgi:hypothetical protein